MEKECNFFSSVVKCVKWTLFLLYLLALTPEAGAQWMVRPQNVQLGTSDFNDADRPHPRIAPHRVHPLSMPSAESPNWPFPNIDVTKSPFEQDEPMVVINPNDTLNILIGANDDRSANTLWAYASTDGGFSWGDTALPLPSESWMLNSDATDPSLAFAVSGDALFLNGHIGDYQNDVACFASSDKGFVWSFRSEPFQDSAGSTDTGSDKYFLTVDRNTSSPFFGRVYVTWVELDVLPNGARYVQIVSAFSTDNGKAWSARRYLSGLGHYIAPVPVTEPDGTLLIAYERYYPNGEIFVVRSTDGGNSFKAPESISGYRNIGPLYPPDSVGYERIGPPDPDSGFAVNSFPSIAVDSSAAHPARAYMVWCGKGSDDRAHVWLTTSDDDGASWRTPRAVEDDTVRNAAARFFPCIAVDPLTGNIGIDYYTSWMDTIPPKHITGGTLMMQAALYMMHSTDGGVSFATRQISSATFDPITQQDYRQPEDTSEELVFFGDYIGIAGRSNTWYPAWTDARRGYDDIYTAIVQPFAPMPVTNLTARDTLIGGKAGSVISWQYIPETTFGYPLPNGYQFSVAKDGTLLVLLGSDSLSFFDTSGSAGTEYEVTVRSGNYRSVTDSVKDGNSVVSPELPLATTSIRFAHSPAISGREDELILDCASTCRVTVTFFDELGRQITPAMSDEMLASHHVLPFVPDGDGVRFFEVKESNPSGTAEIFGKLSVAAE